MIQIKYNNKTNNTIINDVMFAVKIKFYNNILFRLTG